MTPDPTPTREERQEWRRLAGEATPGPWFSQPSEHEPPRGIVYGPDGDSFSTIEWNAGNDYDPVATAAYIAACSPDRVLALLDFVDELQGALDMAITTAVIRGAALRSHD